MYHRVLAACETMGNATNVCSDKTGTLTTNRMTVVEGWIAGKDWAYDNNSNSKLNLKSSVIEVIAEGISHNTTASLSVVGSSQQQQVPEVLGNKTEGALLLFLRNTLNEDYHRRRVVETPYYTYMHMNILRFALYLIVSYCILINCVGLRCSSRG